MPSIPSLICSLSFTLSVFAAVSVQLRDELQLYSQYAAAAFCPDVDEPNGKPGRRLRCRVGNCPMVEASNARVLGGFLDVSWLSSAGYVAVDPTRENIVLAFRGAHKLGYVPIVANYLEGCPDLCENCECAAGPYYSWSLARSSAVSLVHEAQQKYPDYPLVVTGYSIGAWFAAYAAVEFRKNGTNTTLYTYGQGRLGNDVLARTLSEQGQNYRVTNGNDFIVNYGHPGNTSYLPRYSNFRHFEPEYWISKYNEDYSVDADAIDIVWGLHNTTHGNGGTTGLGMMDHALYFQKRLSGCFTLFPPPERPEDDEQQTVFSSHSDEL